MLLDQKRTAALIFEVSDMVTVVDPSHYNLEKIEVRSELSDGYWMEYLQKGIILEQRSSESLKERSYFKEQQFSTVQRISRG